MKEAESAIDGAVKAWEAVQTAWDNKGKLPQILEGVKDALLQWMGNFLDGQLNTGYDIGKLAFDIIFNVATAGVATAAVGAKYMANFIKLFKTFDRTRIKNGLSSLLGKANDIGKLARKTLVCKILGKGCFVKDTPVAMSSKTISKSGRVYALAAGLPFMAMPIQEVPLLSWTVAHETVNEQNNLIASTDEDLYLGLLDGDPYTSQQQKQRDRYELNDTDWYSLSFEQVDGTSKCHFALTDDWIKTQGYQNEKVVNLNLPEQGINGPFRITSIKHIIPQKRPEGDAGDGYDWKPVTGLFEHQSDQVYNISFNNGEELGVTYQHPIYSTTAGDWKLAGELEIGEKILTYNGEAEVLNSEKKQESETVYNLEVKEFHNFLVENSGVVVHNSCWRDTDDLFKQLFNKRYQKIPGTKHGLRKSNPDYNKIEKKYRNKATRNDKGDIAVCFDDYGFPDFTPFAEIIIGIDMNGNSADLSQAVSNAVDQGLVPNGVDLKQTNTKIDGINYTWHHHQDGKHMMLVPSAVNNPNLGGPNHIGGGSLVKNGFKPEEGINPWAEATNPRVTKCK